MRRLLLLLFCFFAAIAGFAQSHRDEFGIQSDNDSYLANHSDRYYTDGLFFYFRHALPVKTDSSSLQNKILGFELGQKIFNPQSGVIPSAIYVDRPFAGYLYAGSTLNLLYKNESNIKLSAQLGVVGPASLGENAQKFVHNAFGFYQIVGWQYQIKNDFELNLGMEYNKLLARGSMADVSLATYANLGTGFTGAGAGPLLRIGAFNQLFHSQSTQSNVIANDKVAPLHKHEFFFYYKPQINWVAYDATIQGGLFESHGSYSFANQEVVQVPKPIVFSQQIGLVYSTNRWVFDLSAIFHTKDTEVMIEQHQWGSVTILYRFH
jgi:lipid A 3-O-deacylase